MKTKFKILFVLITLSIILFSPIILDIISYKYYNSDTKIIDDYSITYPEIVNDRITFTNGKYRRDVYFNDNEVYIGIKKNIFGYYVYSSWIVDGDTTTFKCGLLKDVIKRIDVNHN